MEPLFSDALLLSWGPGLLVSEARGDCERVLGLPSERARGRTLFELFGISRSQARELDAKAQEGSSVAVEWVAAAVNDRSVALRLRLGSSGDTRWATVLNASALLEGAPPLQISRLASSLSHEIRNPLSSVKMAVQTLARNEGLSERDQRRLTIANREIRTMERMLWLLSEYGRDTPPALESAHVRSLVQEAASMVEPELLERQVTLELDEAPELPKVKADAGRLRPVLAQLLLNVAQGLPPGSKLKVRLRKCPGGCEAVIDDPSSAMPPEEQKTLYEPFGSKLARGAGLSLAALRRVMQSHGGEFMAEGSGQPPTTFTLTFAG